MKNMDESGAGFGRNNRVPVLYYHRIAEDFDNPLKRYTLSTTRFKKQMNYLSRRRYRTLSMNGLVEYLRLGKPPPQKSVVITFDDGYRDNLTTAYPVLRKYSFSSITFVVTDYMGSLSFWTTMHNKLYELLTWEEIKNLEQEALFDFQSHSCTHPDLTTLKPEEIIREVKGSKEMISDRLNKEVDYFCYPNGAYNETVKKIVEESGYQAALSCKRPFCELGQDLLELKRIEITHSDFLLNFIFKVETGFTPYVHLRTVWRKMWGKPNPL